MRSFLVLGGLLYAGRLLDSYLRNHRQNESNYVILEQADDARLVDLEARITHRADRDRMGEALHAGRGLRPSPARLAARARTPAGGSSPGRSRAVRRHDAVGGDAPGL